MHDQSSVAVLYVLLVLSRFSCTISFQWLSVYHRCTITGSLCAVGLEWVFMHYQFSVVVSVPSVFGGSPLILYAPLVFSDTFQVDVHGWTRFANKHENDCNRQKQMSVGFAVLQM